jgi:hypothetical protein
LAKRKCRICDKKCCIGTKSCRVRWNEDPVCRECENYILEKFNYNGNHLSVYIDELEYAKGINTAMSLIH